MTDPTQGCTFATIRDLAAERRSLLAERRSLIAQLDAVLVAIEKSWALPAAKVPDRASAATPNAQQVEDDDVANARTAARIVEALSAAGITCELRHLGTTLQ